MTKKPGKHTPYFELLEAQAKPGCSICRLVYRATDRYLDSLLYEAVLDPDVRAKLKTSQGFCREHVAMLGRKAGRALGVALIYRDILRDLVEGLNVQPPRKSLLTRVYDLLPGRRRPPSLAATTRCPACLIAQRHEDSYLDLLLAHLDDPELYEAYAQGDGLCHTHLLRARERVKDPETLARLVQPQIERYTVMLHELDEFIRKRDHRFRHEPMGPEGDVWLRAMNAIAGGAGLGLSAESGGRQTEDF
ncbi:MAG: DUF6062 family protein [Anaerolineae bacterium]